MKIETALNVVNVQDNKIITTRYEQWVNPVNNKPEQRVLVYVVDLYSKQGQAQTYTNGHTVNQLA
jgi:hypothetical protein